MGYVAGTSGADLRSRFKLVSERVREQVRRKIVTYGTVLRQTLVLETPILTGQAKANWQAIVGTPGDQFIGLRGLTSDTRDLAHRPPEAVDYNAYGAVAQAVIDGYQTGQVLYIFSNLPYIERLNSGYSAQAPAGFVESAVLRASAAVRR